jgi:hypothetical protein
VRESLHRELGTLEYVHEDCPATDALATLTKDWADALKTLNDNRLSLFLRAATLEKLSNFLCTDANFPPTNSHLGADERDLDPLGLLSEAGFPRLRLAVEAPLPRVPDDLERFRLVFQKDLFGRNFEVELLF